MKYKYFLTITYVIIYIYIYIYVFSGKRIRFLENDSSRQVIDLLNGNWTWMGNVVWFVDGHGWGWGVVRGWGR